VARRSFRSWRATHSALLRTLWDSWTDE
jgi:hypothetical protein